MKIGKYRFMSVVEANDSASFAGNRIWKSVVFYLESVNRWREGKSACKSPLVATQFSVWLWILKAVSNCT
jgi:hypothetical protein